MDSPHRVVIIGGGFGGLNVARKLRRAPVQITLVDRRNFHLFQPLLYQVATGGLSPANIAAPLRALLRKQQNCEVLLGEVVDIDADRRRVILREGELPYDSLVVATGVRHQYFGHDDWEAMAPGLKTIEDATHIRARVLSGFEEAERQRDLTGAGGYMTFIIVGGGPTGVELTGMICELSRQTLRGNFRQINPADAKILLVEAGDRILSSYPPSQSTQAQKWLEGLGAIVRLNCRVTQIEPHQVTVEVAGHQEVICARTVIWAAGVQASPLGKVLAKATGAQLDRVGRVMTEPDCSIAGHPEIMVIGDLGNFKGADGKPLPGVAQVAIQQGKYVARLITARLGGETLPPFRYRDLGSLATIGRHKAVADFGWCHFGGWLASWIWLIVHLMSIVMFENRVLVLMQWAWSYFTRSRSARLITEVPSAMPEDGKPSAGTEQLTYPRRKQG